MRKGRQGTWEGAAGTCRGADCEAVPEAQRGDVGMREHELNVIVESKLEHGVGKEPEDVDAVAPVEGLEAFPLGYASDGVPGVFIAVSCRHVLHLHDDLRGTTCRVGRDEMRGCCGGPSEQWAVSIRGCAASGRYSSQTAPSPSPMERLRSLPEPPTLRA